VADELLHPVAYYRADGVQKPIKASELTDKDKLHLAKTELLTDKNETVRLWPKFCTEKRPHFYVLNSADKRRISECEIDPAHNERVEEILGKLNSCTVWKVVVNVYVDGKRERETRFSLDDYQWGDEVHRICSSELTIRHDLFGQSKLLSMSVFRPWVAIEVINSHYPDEQTFNEMLRLSRQMPLLVFFDVLSDNLHNYFLKVDNRSDEITPLYYIYEGSMWKGGDRREDIDTTTRFQIEVAADQRRLRDR